MSNLSPINQMDQDLAQALQASYILPRIGSQTGIRIEPGFFGKIANYLKDNLTGKSTVYEEVPEEYYQEPSIFQEPRQEVLESSMKEVQLIKNLPKILQNISRAKQTISYPLAETKTVGKLALRNFKQMLGIPSKDYKLIDNVDTGERVTNFLRSRGSLGMYTRGFGAKEIYVNPFESALYKQNTWAHEFAHAKQYGQKRSEEKLLLDLQKALDERGLINYSTSPIEIHATAVGHGADYGVALSYLLNRARKIKSETGSTDEMLETVAASYDGLKSIMAHNARQGLFNR